MCQGKMPMAMRERYVKMKEDPNHKPNLDMLIENFDRALSHPDKADLEKHSKSCFRIKEKRYRRNSYERISVVSSFFILLPSTLWYQRCEDAVLLKYIPTIRSLRYSFLFCQETVRRSRFPFSFRYAKQAAADSALSRNSCF